MRGRILACALAAALLLPAAARGDTYCAPTALAADCDVTTTLASAAFELAATHPGADTVLLGALEEAGTFTDGGDMVTVIGGRGGPTRLSGNLTLASASSAVQLQVVGDISVKGTVALEDIAVTGGLAVGCGAATVRHVTVAETLEVACDVAEGTATLALANSRAALIDQDPLRTAVTTSYSSYGGTVQRDPTDVVVDDPGFAADSLRPAGGSPLVDAGDPAPLGVPAESLEDADDVARIADGDGDGVARRDIGAFELHPPRTALTGNLLINGGAEEGVVGWAAESAGFEAARYGAEFFPTAATGAALAGGERLFAGGSAHQDVDLRPWALEVDAGRATTDVDALLGGYRADADRASVRLEWLGPAGEATGGAVVLRAPTDAERGNAVTLMPRRLTTAVPPLTRTVRVGLIGEKGPGGDYVDAYFDDVTLRLNAPPAPGDKPPSPPGMPPANQPILRPFAGVTVLTAAATVDSRSRVRVTLGCISATVGRCGGVLTLTASRRAATPFARVGSARFDVMPGRTAVVRIKVASVLARRLRDSRSGRLLGRLYASARDGQGVARTQTSPIVLKRRRGS